MAALRSRICLVCVHSSETLYASDEQSIVDRVFCAKYQMMRQLAMPGCADFTPRGVEAKKKKAVSL